MYPGKRNNLDALCERFGIDHAERTLHGALLDAELLAEAYLAMTRGLVTLTIDVAAPSPIVEAAGGGAGGPPVGRPAPLRVIAPSAEELSAHRDYLVTLDAESGGRCLWLASTAPAADTVPA